MDFINILGINAVATVRSQHTAAAKKRYKDIMLILHPDKRGRYSEQKTGGKEVVDRAMGRVREELEKA